MAMTNAEAIIIAAGTAVAAGGSEAAPPTNGTGAVVGPFADYGWSIAYRIKNGASAPVTTPMTIKFYASSQSTGRWYEACSPVAGDLVANSEYSGLIPLPVGVSYCTAKAFGAGTNGATVEVYLERQVP